MASIDRRADWQIAKQRLRPGPRVRVTGLDRVDHRVDLRQRVQDRLDVPRRQLAAIRQQDQLGGRGLAAAHGVGERQQAAEPARHERQLRQQGGAGRLDAAADLLLLRRRQQAAPADLLQVDADGIGVGDLQPRVGRLVVVRVRGRLHRLDVVEPERRRRLRLFFVDQLVGRQHDRAIGAAVVGDRVQAERLGALAPVEHARVLRRLVPVDELGIVGGVAPPRRCGCRCLLCHGSRLCSSGSETTITPSSRRRRLSLAVPCRTHPMPSGSAASTGPGSALPLPSVRRRGSLLCVTSGRRRKSPSRRRRRVRLRLQAAAGRGRPADGPAVRLAPRSRSRGC